MTEKLQNQYAPDYVTPPGETLEEILDSIGMTKAELSDRIGKTPKHVGDIIKHGAPITPQTAMDLEKVWGLRRASGTIANADTGRVSRETKKKNG